MSDVLDFVRDQAPDLKAVDDETLTQFVGEVFPDFLQNEQFSKRFSLIKEKQQTVSEKVLFVDKQPETLGQALSSLTADELTEIAQKPVIPIPKPEATTDDPIAKQVLTGLTRSGIGLVESVESPMGLALVAASTIPVVGKGIGISAGATFGAKGILDGMRSISDRFKESDYTGAAEALGTIVIGAGMLGVSAKSAVTPKTPAYGPSNLTPLTDAAKKTVAEETAKLPQEQPVATTTPPAEAFKPESLETPGEQTLGAASTTGITPTALNRITQNVIGALRPRGHIPEEAYTRLQMRDSEIAAVDRDIAHGSRDLMDALKTQYDLSSIEMLGGGSKRIPVGDVEMMSRYLKGDPAVGAHIPVEIKGPLDTMRAQIDGFSNNLLDRLRDDLSALPPTSAKAASLQKLIQKIESNMDVYVHRSYKFFDSKKNAPDWYSELPATVRDTAENYLVNNWPTPLAQVQARSLLLDWLSDLKEAKGLGAGKLGSKDPSILMRRKVIPEELRDVLVQDDSPLVLYGKSISKMGKLVANHKFLGDVKRLGMGRWLFEEGTNPPGFNARIAAESSESMSPLNGLRTTQEIADAFSLLDKVPTDSKLARIYYATVAQTKIAATVQSVMTQARNLLSRPLMAVMAGHWDPRPVSESVKNLWADVAGSDKTRQAYIKSGYEYGVLGDTSRARELSELVKDAALQDTQPADVYSWSLARAIKKVGWTIPGETYRLSDELGNLVGWENEVANQRKINPTLPEPELRAKAAQIVREIYPTYSETPEVVRFFRKVPLTGPFVTFPYQIMRTAWNSTMRGIAEMRSSNPAERTVGAKRVAGVATAALASQTLMEMSKAMLGISIQEEEDFRRFQPAWNRNSRFLFYDKDSGTGELSTVNLSAIDPYSYILDPLMAVLSSVRTDEPVDALIQRSAVEFFRPWFSEQMLTGAVVDSLRNTTQTGREVFNPTDEMWEKSLKIGSHIGRTLLPGTVQRVERRIIPAITGEQPPYGRKLEPGPEIARELTGIAIEKLNFKNALGFKASQFKRDDNAAEQVFRSAITTSGTPSKQALVDAYSEMDGRRFEVWKSLRGDFLAALRRGVTVREAKQILESKNVSLAEANAIARGQYLPMQVSPALRTRARELKRELPVAEIGEIITKNRNKTLD